jgi:DNA-binding LacI/PurR family transcriptional regulator
MLGNTDERMDKERCYLEALSSQRVDGMILATSGLEHVRLIQRRAIPLVLVDRTIPREDIDSIVTDAYDGGRQLVAHLLEQGHREIAFVGGPAGNSTLEARLAGCRDTMRTSGLTLTVRLGRFDQASGDELTTSLIAEGIIPQAIIAANNLVAVGTLVALRRGGLRVPGDVGLACFGEIELASLIDPFLTVIREPAYESGSIAMEMLQERIAGSKQPARHRVLPVELVARRSSCRDA